MEGFHTIGILSDTHGLLRPQVLEILKGCDAIIHGGDINKAALLDELRELGTVYAVRGNNDKGPWAEGLEEQLRAELWGLRVFIIHNKAHISKASLEDADVVVFGHSHKFFCEKREGALWLNPGSCGKRRFHQEITLATMEVFPEKTIVRKYTILDDKVEAEKLQEISF